MSLQQSPPVLKPFLEIAQKLWSLMGDFGPLSDSIIFGYWQEAMAPGHLDSLVPWRNKPPSCTDW